MLEGFTAQTFADHLGTPFKLEVEGSEVALELVDVIAAPADGAREAAGLREPFSIQFLQPGDEVLPQRTYPVRHATLGVFELFMVPVSRDAAGTRYEAVFG